MSYFDSLNRLRASDRKVKLGMPLTDKERRLRRREPTLARAYQMKIMVHGLLAREGVPVIQYFHYDTFTRTLQSTMDAVPDDRLSRITEAIEKWVRLGLQERVLRSIVNLFCIRLPPPLPPRREQAAPLTEGI